MCDNWEERKLQLRKLKVLQRELDQDLIGSLAEVWGHAADVDGAKEGVDKLEFILGMLVNLELVQASVIRRLSDRFDTLDVERDGVLDKADLTRMVRERRHEVQAADAGHGMLQQLQDDDVRRSVVTKSSLNQNEADTRPSYPPPHQARRTSRQATSTEMDTGAVPEVSGPELLGSHSHKPRRVSNWFEGPTSPARRAFQSTRALGQMAKGTIARGLHPSRGRIEPDAPEPVPEAQ